MKSELIKEANRLKPLKKNDFESIVFEKYLKKDELKRKNIRKSFRLKTENKDIIGKKRRAEKIRPIMLRMMMFKRFQYSVKVALNYDDIKNIIK